MKTTTLCYIECDHKYLMLHRTKKENDDNHDKWIGIGGKIENGESPTECVIREALEETGLTLHNPTFRGIVHFRNDYYPDEDMYLFVSKDFSGTIKECDEGILAWIDIDKLYSLTLWEGDKIFLEALKKDERIFDLTLNYSKEELLSYNINYK